LQKHKLAGRSLPGYNENKPKITLKDRIRKYLDTTGNQIQKIILIIPFINKI
jgi:hypothetical protein